MLVTANEVKLKWVPFIIPCSPNDQFIDGFGDVVHFMHDLFICFLFDCVGEALCLFNPIECQQLDEAIVFIGKAKPQLSQVAVAIGTFELCFFVYDLCDAFLAESVSADKNPWEFVSFIELLKTHSALEIAHQIIVCLF